MKKRLTHLKSYFFRPFRWFGKTRRRNKILTLVGIIILVIAANSILARGNGDGQYTTESVTRGDIVQVVSETGEISTGGASSMYSPTNGVVEEVFVANGDTVTAGQNLFTVVSTATEQEKAAAYASYLQAKTTLDAANAQMHTLQSQMFGAWDSYKDYAEDHEMDEERRQAEYIVLEKDWFAAEAKYKNQQGVVSQAQAALSSASLSYQATQNATVRATSNGTIANLSISPGARVQAFSQMTPVAPALTIATFSISEIQVGLGESDVSQVTSDQDVVIDVQAVDDREYSGVVRRVDTIGTDVEGVTVFHAYIEVLDADAGLRPGMTADVEITTEKLENVLVVPNSAVKPYKGGRAVRVVGADGEIEYVSVHIGVRGVSQTQIISGIKEGQEVITALSNDQIQRPGPF